MRVHRTTCVAVSLLVLLLAETTAFAQDLPRGEVLDDVKCLDAPSESYALYVPSTYSPGRSWSLLMGFHPGARGRAIVDTYRAAAEQYGYIVAASNNSRNGPWEVSARAILAMSADLSRRFAINVNRVYLTGLSGGARVAMQVALSGNKIAGVIASSAGYPDAHPRSSLPFVVFGTAGSDDFNYIEMRRLDAALKTPHRVVIFNGGHTLPPDDVARAAIEWLELQAMASGSRAKDDALIDRLLGERQQAMASAGESAQTVHLLRAVAEDFKGLRDVSSYTARAAQLAKQKDISRALSRERDDDEAEARVLDDVASLEAGLNDDARRLENLGDLRDRLTKLSSQATAAAESPERARARRVLRIITMGAAERVRDPVGLEVPAAASGAVTT